MSELLSIPSEQATSTRRANYYPLSESLLLEQLECLLPDHIEERGGRAFFQREVGVGRSIADLVVLVGPVDRQSHAFGSLTVLESVVLWALRKKTSTRIDVLERQCGLKKHDLREGALRRLESWDMITRGSGGRVALTRNWFNRYTVIAFEAKLYRWRDAIRQAQTYRKYAEESYVVLPGAYAGPALRSQHEFAELGVGLIVASKTDLSVVVEAKPSDEHDWRREFVCSRLLKHAKEAEEEPR